MSANGLCKGCLSSQINAKINGRQKCQSSELAKFTSNLKYYIVSVNTIYDQAFVVPDIASNENTILYVYPLDDQKKLFLMNIVTQNTKFYLTNFIL